MSISRTGLLGLVLVGAVGLTGCGSDEGNAAADSGTTSAATTDCATGALTSGGSSAQANAMTEWVNTYQGKCAGTTINYQSVGSGTGRQNFISGTFDFAGSDSALSATEQPAADARCGAGGKAINLPMVTGPIAVTYNLPNVDEVVLDGATLAKIFNDKIATWDDPAIKALNPSVTLPSLRIQAFHRGDDSGTTDNFQKFLGAAAAADWTTGAGSKFTGVGGQAAQKSDGVTNAVKSTEGAVTYVEQSFAENAQLPIAQIATGASSPVTLSPETVGKAIEGAQVTGTGNDLALKLDYGTKAEGAYPILLVTYEVVCEKGLAPEKAALVKSFLTYTASDEGQSILEDNGYVGLPEAVRSKVAASVAALG
ncbi:MAG TPA: phosphate ABC transporter substrate-binding protein PstS [Mycobacteriales bacterium]|nr:phosphate ABC transporter substrate-binding protein PstS [Mycobacteriales bacterium]